LTRTPYMDIYATVGNNIIIGVAHAMLEELFARNLGYSARAISHEANERLNLTL